MLPVWLDMCKPRHKEGSSLRYSGTKSDLLTKVMAVLLSCQCANAYVFLIIQQLAGSGSVVLGLKVVRCYVAWFWP